MRLGRLAEAADAHERALSCPNVTEAALIYARLAKCLLMLGDHARAEAAFRQALAVDPECAEARAGMEEVLWQQDRSVKTAEIRTAR
jgi:Tfp pilus assembly protein PilF